MIVFTARTCLARIAPVRRHRCTLPTVYRYDALSRLLVMMLLGASAIAIALQRIL